MRSAPTSSRRRFRNFSAVFWSAVPVDLEYPREIANEFGARCYFFDSGVREMCGNGVQNQPKPAENAEAKCNVF
jgi:hypothetical protein